ncbi:MAG: hypothetical protein U1E53_00610 [Dongiaceae bacterium]
MRLPIQSAGRQRAAGAVPAIPAHAVRPAQASGFVWRPPRRRIGGLVANPPRGPVQASIDRSCTYGNDNIARCDYFFWDCGDDDVCVQGGTIFTECFDDYGRKVPC